MSNWGNEGLSIQDLPGPIAKPLEPFPEILALFGSVQSRSRSIGDLLPRFATRNFLGQLTDEDLPLFEQLLNE